MDSALPNLLCMSILCTTDVGTRSENAHLSNYRISYLPYTMQSFNARIRPTFLRGVLKFDLQCVALARPLSVIRPSSGKVTNYLHKFQGNPAKYPAIACAHDETKEEKEL
jgi:hypothetical protein